MFTIKYLSAEKFRRAINNAEIDDGARYRKCVIRFRLGFCDGLSSFQTELYGGWAHELWKSLLMLYKGVNSSTGSTQVPISFLPVMLDICEPTGNKHEQCETCGKIQQFPNPTWNFRNAVELFSVNV